MGQAQLLLFLFFSSIFSSISRSVPGDVPLEDGDDVEPTFKHICEGIEVDLKNCNGRLMEKTEYTQKIESELFAQKRQLRQLRISCKDAIQASSVQIAAVQNQLDSLLQQLGEKATGPAKDVLDILQKFINTKKLELDINMETNPEKILELEEQLKKQKAELKKMSVDLSQSKCPTGNSSRIVAEIADLQEKIDKLKKGSGASAESPEVVELQKELEKKLKILENSGEDTIKKVTDVIKDQNEVLDLQRRLAELLKIQAEYEALQERLKEKNNLLSDLKEEKEEKGSNSKIDKEISAVEKQVWALEDQLVALNRSLSEKEGLEKDLREKKKQLEDKIDAVKKDDEDLLSKYLNLQFKLQELQIQADGEKKAAQFQIEDLEKQLRMREETISQLQAQNYYLEEQLADRAAECEDLQAEYEKMSKKLDKTIEQLPDQNLKRIVEIISLNIDTDNIKSRMESEKTEHKLNDLQKQLKDKTNQLNLKKKELQESDPNAAEIVKIIDKMQEIQKRQNEVKNMDSLDQINDLQQDLLKLINKLQDSNQAKLVLKNMVMISDVNWLKKLINSTTEQSQKQIIDLEELVNQKEEEIKKKTAELVKKDSDVDKLTKEIFSLNEEVKKLNEEIKKVEESSEEQVTQLQKQLKQTEQKLEVESEALKQKDLELAEKVTKITQLIEELRQIKQESQDKDKNTTAKITDLEEKLKNSENEKTKLKADKEKLKEELEEAKKCTELQKSYDELKNQYENEMSQMNDSFARQVLTIQTLSKEVEELQENLNKTTGNRDEVKQKLQEKIRQLEEKKKELRKTRADSAEVLKLLEMTKKMSKQKDTTISEYLAEITRQEKEMDEMLAKLASTGDEKAKLTIQVVVLNSELAKLEKVKADLEKETSEKTASLEKEIEEKNKEIAYLKSSGCGANELKEKIAQLQRELRDKQRELTQLKKSTDSELEKLNKKLAEKTKKLENTGAKLKEKDAVNADLIQRLADMGEQLKEALSGKNTFKQTAEKQINDLKKKVEKKEKEVLELKNNNEDLTEQVKNKENEVSQLQNSNTALKEEAGRRRKELAKMEQEVKDKEEMIDSLKKEVQEKDEIIQTQGGCQDAKKENQRLRKSLAEVNARRIELENVYDANEELKEQLAAANAKILDLQQAIKKTDKAEITVVSPQMDPDTAHRRLLLSDKGRSVKGSEFSRFVPNNPERYDTAIAALARVGYRSGRYYWEVQVENRACFMVGVATESAQRKGEITYSPKNGYWTILRKKDGRYQALTQQPTTLHLSGQLCVVGILLDFNNREVIFYNAKSRAIVYTFSDILMEKLYPYIGTCTDQNKDEPPIKILEPQSVFWADRS